MTTANKQQYDETGYALKEGLIPREVTDAVRMRVHEIIENQPEWGARSFHCVDPEFKRSSKGQPYPGGLQLPARHEEVFATMANHPNLVDAMAELLGGEVETELRGEAPCSRSRNRT